MDRLSSVTFKSRHDMHVEVGHRLSRHRSVIHAYRKPVRLERFFYMRRPLLDHDPQRADFPIRNPEERLVMGSGDDHGMPGRPGVDIQKRHYRVVLVYLIGGNFPRGNLTKEAIRHLSRFFISSTSLRKGTVSCKLFFRSRIMMLSSKISLCPKISARSIPSWSAFLS